MSNDNYLEKTTDLAEQAKRDVISQVLSDYKAYNAAGYKSHVKRKVFNTRSGDTTRQGVGFEKELASIIAAVRLQAEGNSGEGNKDQFRRDASAMMWGEESAGFKNIVQNAAKGVISEINKGASNVICNTNSKLGKYAISSVSGKIDVSGLGVEWKITASPTSYLYKIANLLSQASFTAKSYSSLVWDQK